MAGGEGAASSDVGPSDAPSSPSTVPMTAADAASAAAAPPSAAADSSYVRADSGPADGGAEDTAPLVPGSRNRPKPWLYNAPPDYEEEEPIAVVVHRTSRRHLLRLLLLPRLPSPRPLLLGLGLSVTLATFWLLDSLKDPVFAELVSGDLSRHQPRAKIVSVGGTLCLVVAMELLGGRWARRRAAAAAAAAEDRRMDDDEVLDGGGRWTRMTVGGPTPATAGHDDDGGGGVGGGSATRIPISIFRAVGVPYLTAFAAVGLILSRHPDPENASPEEGEEQRRQQETRWRILGYALYLLIESYGSISVAAFWAYANSTLTVTAAERWYGTIVALAQLGAIGGSTVAASREHGGSGNGGAGSFVADVAPLFYLACLGIVAQVGIMALYGAMFPRPMRPEDDDAVAAEEDGDEEEDETAGAAAAALAAAAAFDRMAAPSSLTGRRPDARYGPRSPSSSVGDDGPIRIGIDGRAEKEAPSSSRHHPALSGLFLILRHRYVLLILGVSCLYEISLTCLDYEMKLIGLDRFGEEASIIDGIGGQRQQGGATLTTGAGGGGPGFQSMIASTFAQFMGRYGQLTNVLSLVLSYFAFPYLMRTRGLRLTLRIFPTLLVLVTVLTFVALPTNLFVLFVSVSLLKAMTYSVNDPAKEILYIPTSNVIKFRAKFWIDVVGARIAKALGSSINTYAGSAERIVQVGYVPSVLTALGLWAVCYRVGWEFDGLLARGEIVGAAEDDEIANDAVVLDGYYDAVGDEEGDGADYRYDDEVVGGAADADRPSFESGDAGEDSGPEVELVSRLS